MRACVVCGNPAERTGNKKKSGEYYYTRRCWSCRKLGKGQMTIESRFWERVEKTASCWLWTGTKDRYGYGRLGVTASRAQSAHRISWELHHGAIPDAASICHACDNPSCVNPDHLFLGGHADNMRDMAAKDRSLHGTKNVMAKLIPEQVVEIFLSDLTCRELSSNFNVSETTIKNIKRRQTWRRVTAELFA